jgi:hypothetical protein
MYAEGQVGYSGRHVSIATVGTALMRGSPGKVDRVVAGALRGTAGCSVLEHIEGREPDYLSRASYHGVASLLFEREKVIKEWPFPVVAALRKQAVAQAMWELRHRAVLSDFIEKARMSSLLVIILKGTASAYDLYANPSSRQRADTDVLVHHYDLAGTRELLRQSGYRCALEEFGAPDPTRLQEPWVFFAPDGSDHTIDLHWSVLNSWHLRDLFSFSEVLAGAQEIPRLCNGALSPGRVFGLLHACLHREQHVVSPYIVDAVLHYGGDRLIWLFDIYLLMHALSADEWDEFCALALRKGVASVCLRGIEAAVAELGARCPADVGERLAIAPSGTKAASYLQSRQVARAWMDFWALPGLVLKASHLAWRILPPAEFIRAKYPDMAHLWVPLLYLRRGLSFVFWRGGHKEAGKRSCVHF